MQAVLQKMSESTDDFVVAVDSMGTIVFADEEVLAFLGRTKAEVGALNVGEVLDEAEIAWLARVAGRMFADAPVMMPQQVRARGARGSIDEFLCTAVRFNRPDGAVLLVAILKVKAGESGERSGKAAVAA